MADRPVRSEAAFRLHLEHEKQQAKQLCRALRNGDPEAIARFRAHHPRAAAAADDEISTVLGALAHAQLVIARERGLPSWPKLKAHVEELTEARADIAAQPPPDREMETLHIRCGSDIAPVLRQAGFVGDFLEYSDPLCVGPVVAGPDRLMRRARFLSDSYGAAMGFSYDQSLAGLQQQEERLAAARQRARVVLWFEHDSYDQLILARCLAQFAEAGAPGRLELISIDHFPGALRFVGLGQLPPEALRLLWRRRAPVSPQQLALGAAVWSALQASDPRTLAAVACRPKAALPYMGPALRRHLQELPWRSDGLSLTQRLVLELLQEASRSIGQIFTVLTQQREPLPWLGDTMLLALIEEMRAATDPTLTIVPETRQEAWPRRRLELTDAGSAVLAGTRDYLALGPPERWVGGVAIRPASAAWRWDGAAEAPVLM